MSYLINKKYKILIIILPIILIISSFLMISNNYDEDNNITLKSIEKINYLNNSYFEIYKITDNGQCINGITSYDFNNDNKLDIAFSSATLPFNYSKISILFFSNDMQYNISTIYYFNYSYIDDLDSGDYDNDGDTDFIITYSEYDEGEEYKIKTKGIVTLLYNNGKNDFDKIKKIIEIGSGDPLDFHNRVNPRITSHDYDNDGDIDLIIGDNSGLVELYFNDGKGNFTNSNNYYDFGNYSWGMCSKDLNYDGYCDLLVSSVGDLSNTINGKIFLIYNDQSEKCFNFDNAKVLIANISRPGYPGNIITLDYEFDGDIDIIFGNLNKLFYYENNDNEFIKLKSDMIISDSNYYLEDFSMGGASTVDLNYDDKMDFIIGGVQGNIYIGINKNIS